MPKIPTGDSCGCKTGAWFMLVGIIISSSFFGWQYFAGQSSLVLSVLKVLLSAFLAGGIGKTFGILRYRQKRKSSLSQTLS
jgi:hypothetical protein